MSIKSDAYYFSAQYASILILISVASLAGLFARRTTQIREY